MKLSIHKKISSISTMLAAGIFTVSCVISQAEAAVIWTFNQVGDDVVASATGSFSIDVVADITSFTPSSAGTSTSLNSLSVGHKYGISKGIASSLSGVVGPDAASGGAFGHSGTFLYWDNSIGGTATLLAGVDVASGNGGAPTLTWLNKTVSTVFGAGFFNSGPVVAWTLTGEDSTNTISYVDPLAVPEPSSTLLVGFGALALLARRKR